jgi:hypothetical protein
MRQNPPFPDLKTWNSNQTFATARSSLGFLLEAPKPPGHALNINWNGPLPPKYAFIADRKVAIICQEFKSREKPSLVILIEGIKEKLGWNTAVFADCVFNGPLSASNNDSCIVSIHQ